MRPTASILRRNVILQLCAVTAACATGRSRPIVNGILDVDGGAIAFKRRAASGPTIVFESGLGDGLESWEPLFPLLASASSFFAYSRPGYGESTSAHIENGMVTAAEVAQRLHRILGSAGVRAPYLLVGHSLGGMYISRYAELFPDTVHALVFVDARPPGFFAHCAREGASCGTRVQRPADWPAHILAEAAGIPEAEAHGLDNDLIAGLPATIITTTRPGPAADGVRVRQLWIAEQHVLAETFRDHRFVEAMGSGHYVHHDEPGLVAREIAARL